MIDYINVLINKLEDVTNDNHELYADSFNHLFKIILIN